MIQNLEKIKVENTSVWGFEHAMRGMRNPMNSWERTDTVEDGDTFAFVGDNDMKLAQNLIKAGPEHRKYLRMIHVAADFTLPRYIWSEFDTYHFNTQNSCSTMHKLLNNKEPISLEQFVYSDTIDILMGDIVDRLNDMRNKYFIEKAAGNSEAMNDLIEMAKQLLPEGFLQLRTRDTNYEELRNVYRQRKNHRLHREWGVICRWIESLPYAKELLIS